MWSAISRTTDLSPSLPYAIGVSVVPNTAPPLFSGHEQAEETLPSRGEEAGGPAAKHQAASLCGGTALSTGVTAHVSTGRMQLTGESPVKGKGHTILVCSHRSSSRLEHTEEEKKKKKKDNRDTGATTVMGGEERQRRGAPSLPPPMQHCAPRTREKPSARLAPHSTPGRSPEPRRGGGQRWLPGQGARKVWHRRPWSGARSPRTQHSTRAGRPGPVLRKRRPAGAAWRQSVPGRAASPQTRAP